MYMKNTDDEMICILFNAVLILMGEKQHFSVLFLGFVKLQSEAFGFLQPPWSLVSSYNYNILV